MPRLVPPTPPRQERSPDPEPDGALPLRWALIIVAATGCGLAVGVGVGLVPGVTVGIAAAGLLHKVLAKR